MTLRYGKNFSHMLNVAARLDADFGRGTHFLLETSPQQTRLQKAIRQRVKLLSKNKRRGPTEIFSAAPPSIVDLLAAQKNVEWLQQPGEHSFSDELNGISAADKLKEILLKSPGVAVEDYASDEVLTPSGEVLRTLLADHGSDAYKALVRGAKVGPLF
jgi:hypothetical protein